jgi:hypothetical protein
MAKLLKGSITNNVLELNLLDESINLLSTGSTPTVVIKHSGINVNEQIVGDIPDDKYKYVLPYDERVKGLHIGTSCTSIGSYSFAGASELAGSLVIPDSVITINNYAFIDCNNITSIIIGRNVTSIGSLCFTDCTGLTEITIPNSITDLSELVFSGCINVNTINIYCSSDVFEPFENQFSGCINTITINVRSDDNSWDKFVTNPEVNNIIQGGLFGAGAGNGTLELNKIL